MGWYLAFHQQEYGRIIRQYAYAILRFALDICLQLEEYHRNQCIFYYAYNPNTSQLLLLELHCHHQHSMSQEHCYTSSFVWHQTMSIEHLPYRNIYLQ